MKEDYVSFKVAKLLKEKGFDECCHKIYEEDGILCGNGDYLKNSDSDIKLIDDEYDDSHVFITAPTLQMAMKWLREVHNLFIEIHFCQDTYEDVCCEVGWKEPTYNYRIIGIGNNDADYVDTDFNSYEEACESAIKYCLTNLI